MKNLNWRGRLQLSDLQSTNLQATGSLSPVSLSPQKTTRNRKPLFWSSSLSLSLWKTTIVENENHLKTARFLSSGSLLGFNETPKQDSTLSLSLSQAIAGTSSKANAKLQVQASLREKAVTGLTAAALTASMVIPEVAEAAGSDLSPSLKNFLLSIVAGGVVLGAIFAAVIGVANFDPVKRT